MNHEQDEPRGRGRLSPDNRPGDPHSAPRCGARNRRGGPVRPGDARADALSAAWREKHGADDARGPRPHPRRQDHHRALVGRRACHGGVAPSVLQERLPQPHRARLRDHRGMDGRAYLRARLAREEAEGIAPAVVEAERQAVRAAITQRDVAWLRAKGVLPGR